MADLKTTNGELVIENGDFVYQSGIDAIDQHLLFTLRFFKGEWFLDLRVGIPYFQQVLIKNPDAVALNSIFKQAILNTPGVIELTGFSLDFDPALRILSVNFVSLIDENRSESLSE